MSVGHTWQVMLADLSLILFLTTSAAVSSNAQPAPDQTQHMAKEASSIFVDRPYGPSLSSWLKGQQVDPREQLTIRANFAEGGRNAALGRASVLAEQAMALGVVPRVIIEPADHAEIIAMFAYDRDEEMAQALQDNGQNTAS